MNGIFCASRNRRVFASLRLCVEKVSRTALRAGSVGAVRHPGESGISGRPAEMGLRHRGQVSAAVPVDLSTRRRKEATSAERSTLSGAGGRFGSIGINGIFCAARNRRVFGSLR
jgi:hypothetical protein